jgi:uncharacterized membrane protein YqgA involved in biofilm formation
MIGTILNAITVAIGSTLGILVGDRLPERIQQSVVTGLGLVTLTVGLDNALQTTNIIVPLLSIGPGVIIGEMLDLDRRLESFGGWLQKRFDNGGSDTGEEAQQAARARFINGFVTASIVFCVGPLTFIGSIQDGMTGDYELLAIKSVLDGFASLAFASAMGPGVAFSIITILVLQGGLAFLGATAGSYMSDPMITEMTATGGLLLIGLALILLDIKKPRMANFLPALIIAPTIVVIATALGISIAPF